MEEERSMTEKTNPENQKLRARSKKAARIFIALACLITMAAQSLVPQQAAYAESEGSESSGVKAEAQEKAQEKANDALEDDSDDDAASIMKSKKKLDSVRTKVTGFRTSYTKNYRRTIRDTITISPAYGRKVILKRYDPYLKKWVVEKTYHTKDKKKAKLRIKYTNTWRAYPSSKWLISIPRVKQRERNGKTMRPMKKRVLHSTIRVKKFHHAGHAVIFDAETGKCLYDYNATKKTSIASMRKMMTGVLLCEHKKPRSKIRVRELNRNTITLGLKSGDIVRAKDLMYGMFLPSSNDCASAAAAGVGGTHSKFIRMMNKKARKLKMKRTRYSSPVGDRSNPRYKTTVYDQALLGRYIMTSKTTKFLRKVLLKKRYSFTSLRFRKHYKMKAGNKLIGTKYKSIGIKTCYNGTARWCFCNAWKYKGKLYISVVTRCPTRKLRWKSVKALTKFTKYAVNHDGEEITVKE